MTTRTKNNTLAEIAEFLKTLDRVAVTTHVGSDGDAIGASAALVRLMRRLGATAVFCHAEGAPEYLGWLLPDEPLRELPPDHDLLVADTSRADRTGVPVPEAGARLNIDHHEDNPLYAEYNLVSPRAAATAEIVADLYAELDVPIDRPAAEALYVGIKTDTGGFNFRNISPRAHELVADLLRAGVVPAEVNERINRRGSIEQLRIVGVSLANAVRYGEALISTVEKRRLRADRRNGARLERIHRPAPHRRRCRRRRPPARGAPGHERLPPLRDGRRRGDSAPLRRRRPQARRRIHHAAPARTRPGKSFSGILEGVAGSRGRAITERALIGRPSAGQAARHNERQGGLQGQAPAPEEDQDRAHRNPRSPGLGPSRAPPRTRNPSLPLRDGPRQVLHGHRPLRRRLGYPRRGRRYHRSSTPLSPRKNAIRDALPAFTGDLLQVPPMASALKRGGMRLYDLHRRGISVEREARPVTVHRLRTRRPRPHRTDGHVRGLLQQRYLRKNPHRTTSPHSLGSGAYLTALRRTSVGHLTVRVTPMPPQDLHPRNPT